MALKFLNKKGWHTGSLRNIENVWKAEQKHDAEQKKLEELRKQIHEEREKAEFRLLQEQAGLVPKQERLDFLYESGLAVGKGSSDGFKALETLPKTNSEAASSSSAKPQQQQASVPGALFEEKPQSANDAWRKLHSDPLLLIRQREQEALARVKNNPIQMAMIRKSVETKKQKEKNSDGKEREKKRHHKKSKHRKHSSPELEIDQKDGSGKGEEKHTSDRRSSRHDQHLTRGSSEELPERDTRRERDSYTNLKYKKKPHGEPSEPTAEQSEDEDRSKRNHDKARHEKRTSDSRSFRHDERLTKAGSENLRERDNQRRRDSYTESNYKRKPPGEPLVSIAEQSLDRDRNKRHHESSRNERNRIEGRTDDEFSRQSEDRDGSKRNHEKSKHDIEGQRDYEHSRRGKERNSPDIASRNVSHPKRRNNPSKLSEEERAARLREMQMDAELHDEQRWKRIKKAEEKDAEEALRARTTSGKNFLDAAQRSVYGAEKGGSSTIEESVRRRTHYLQDRSEATERNAFRR